MRAAEVGIGRAIDVVMQVVELADRGEPGLQHLHVDEGRDRLDVVGRQLREEAVHHLAPGPETVGPRSAPFGEPGHGALEGMAVQIRNAGHRDASDSLGASVIGSAHDRNNRAAVHGDAHVTRPPRW
jgi:hypothetical protein